MEREEEDYIKSVLSDITSFMRNKIPNFGFDHGYSYNHSTNMFTDLSVTPMYKHFRDSDYHYSEKRKFIHYTNLHKLFSMLNEGALRLYNLKGVNDPQELQYSLKLINQNINFDSIREYRDRIFFISLNEYDKEINTNSFLNWRLYGGDGYGVGVVLEFDILENIAEMMLSKVYYSQNEESLTKQLRDLKEIVDFIINNERKYNRINIYETFEPLIATLSAFHKMGLYHHENEVRFLYHIAKLQDDEYHFETFADIDSNFNKRRYYKLPLNRKDSIPVKVSIDKIILGHNLSNFEQIRDVIHEVSERTLKEKITVSKSPISWYFD